MDIIMGIIGFFIGMQVTGGVLSSLIFELVNLKQFDKMLLLKNKEEAFSKFASTLTVRLLLFIILSIVGFIIGSGLIGFIIGFYIIPIIMFFFSSNMSDEMQNNFSRIYGKYID